MPITNQTKWENWVTNNTNPYGKRCVDVARKAMELLDMPEYQDFNPHKLIDDADNAIQAGGITGFMAGCVAQMISGCHSRGEEYRKKWNTDTQIHDEGDKANKEGGILNPAILTIK